MSKLLPVHVSAGTVPACPVNTSAGTLPGVPVNAGAEFVPDGVKLTVLLVPAGVKVTVPFVGTPAGHATVPAAVSVCVWVASADPVNTSAGTVCV